MPPLTPHEKRAARLHQQAVQRAYNLLKNQAAFPQVQVEAMEGADRINESHGNQLPKPPLPSAVRLEFALKILDVEAGAYVKLVVSIETQEAFTVLLQSFGLEAWSRYCGLAAGIEPFQGNREWAAIQDRLRHWTKESYKRLIPPRSDEELLVKETIYAGPVPPRNAVADARQSYLLPILERCGMTKSKWAAKAGVDPSVVYDYLEGKSDPRPENRKALADAIGLSLSDLPR